MVPKAESEKIPKIKQIIESFVLAVSETAITNNISEGMLSLLRPLYLFVAVDSQRVYLVFSNRGAIRGQTQWFYYEHEKEAVMAPDAPMKAAIKDLGFPHDDVSYVSLPARLLEMNEAKWEVELQKIAYEYVQS